MRTKRWAGLLALVLLLSLCGGALATAARVYDGADLFTASEEAALEEESPAFRRKRGWISWSSPRMNPRRTESRSRGRRVYVHGNFGLDSEDSGVLYYIDMYNRYQYIYTRGQMIDYLTGTRIDAATGGSQSLLAQGDYVGAVEEIMERVRGYLRDGIPEGQYRYDILTGEMRTARKKALTTAEAAVCAAVAAAAGLAFVTLVKRSYRLKGSTYSYNFRENCDLTITGRVDDYIRTTTTQARKPDPPRSSGGGGYHGGGSGVHTSVGGGHHGGGGGHF